MIEFLGTPLLASIPLDSEKLNLAALCGVNMTRAEAFAEALGAAKDHSFFKEAQLLVPGMPPVMGEFFSLGRLVEHAQLDADTPQEILLVGLLVGRLFTEMEHQAAAANKRITKMMTLFNTDPTKALRKMQKDINKHAGKTK